MFDRLLQIWVGLGSDGAGLIYIFNYTMNQFVHVLFN